jgi:hypothetical protein
LIDDYDDKQIQQELTMTWIWIQTRLFILTLWTQLLP